MKNLFLSSALIVILIVAFVSLPNEVGLWGADGKLETSKGKAGKNLQILTIDSVVDLQNEMKVITKSLGTDCKFCHELKDFAADVPKLHKDIARQMLTMVNEINEKYFKETKIKITCFTCHRGHKEPVMTVEEWDKILQEEKDVQK